MSLPLPPLHGLTIHSAREDRVRKSCEKLTKAVNSKQQGRIDGFFTVKPKEAAASSSKSKAKGEKDDSKTKSTKRKVCSLPCRCRVPTEIVSSRQRRRRRRVIAQRRRGRKNDPKSSKTHIPCSRGRCSYVTCIFRALLYLLYYTFYRLGWVGFPMGIFVSDLSSGAQFTSEREGNVPV